MPPSAEVYFSFRSAEIVRLPAFLFLKLGIKAAVMSEFDQQYELFVYRGDMISTDEVPLSYLQRVPWAEVDPYVSLSPDTRAALADLWSGKGWSGYNVELQSKKLPKELRTQVQLVQTTSSRDEVR